MNLHSLIVDDFLPDFPAWRQWADGCRYEDELNAVDGVTYPLICRAVPRYGMSKRLSIIMGRDITLNSCFLRMSPSGAPVPHQAHHDASMGHYSCMVYMNRPEHCRGGTALVEHVSGACDAQTWRMDANTPERWRVLSLCDMAPNRAFIFRADLMHRAEPVGGFGSTPEDARLVMTAFFSI